MQALPHTPKGAKFVALKKFVVPAQYDGDEDKKFWVYIAKDCDGRWSPGAYILRHGPDQIGKVTVVYSDGLRVKKAFVHSLHIDEDYRGVGIGSWFMKVICDQARRNGAYMISLNCSDERRNFYSRLGFSASPSCDRSMFMLLGKLSPVDEWLIKFFSVTMYIDYAISDGKLGDIAIRIGTIAIAFLITIGVYAVRPTSSWLWITLPILIVAVGTAIATKFVSPIRHEMLVLIKREGRHPDIVIDQAAGLLFPLQKINNPALDMLSKTLSLAVIVVSLTVLAALLVAIHFYF